MKYVAPHPIPTLYDAQRWYIAGALRLHEGNISATAKALGLHRASLQRKLRKLGIAPNETGAPSERPLQTR